MRREERKYYLLMYSGDVAVAPIVFSGEWRDFLALMGCDVTLILAKTTGSSWGNDPFEELLANSGSTRGVLGQEKEAQFRLCVSWTDLCIIWAGDIFCIGS